MTSSFYKGCGDSFVYEEEYGASLVADIIITFASSSQASSFSTSTSASYSTMAHVSASVNTGSNSENNN